MTHPNYLIATTGQLNTTKNQNEVISALARNFKLSTQTAAILVIKPKIVKKGLTLEEAKQYKAAFLKCGLIVTVIEENSPAHQRFAYDANLQANKEEISKILQGSPVKFKTSATYKLGLLATVLLSFIAPLLYFCLITASAYTTYWLAFNLVKVEWFIELPTFFRTWIYIFFVFVGCVFTAFLIRPLFLKSGRRSGRILLDEKRAPLFFHLVKELSQKFGQPMPSEIYVCNDINAYVAPRKGVTSLIRKDLTLTVGLPLIASMNTRQLAGVLSHEFGHFTQTSAMITNYIINSISYWLASRVWHKDRFEQRLREWQELDNGLALLSWCALRLINVSRHLLKQFYNLNNMICQLMSRQMEYDADRYECYISGSDYFEQTALTLWKISYGLQLTEDLNQKAWNSNKLIDNLPYAISEETRKLNKQAITMIQERMTENTTKWWDSHPADSDRIKHAKKQGYQAIWTSEESAEKLFGDFEQLCTSITNNEYSIGTRDQSDTTLISYSQALEEIKLENKETEALEEFQLGLASYRCLYLPDTIRPAKQFENTIQSLQEQKDTWEKADQNYWEGRSITTEAIYAKLLLEADVPIPASLDEYETPEDCDKAIAKYSRKWQTASQQLKQIDTLLAQRIANAMTQMSEPEILNVQSQIRFFKLLERTENYWLDLRRYAWLLEKLLEEDLFGDEVAPIIQRYKKFTKEALDNFINFAFPIEIAVNNHPTKTFEWWFKEWVEDYNPKADFSADHIQYIAENTGRLIFYLIGRTSASMAYHCINAEQRATKFLDTPSVTEKSTV